MTETLEAQLETLSNENAFLQKYFSLRKKCEQLQQVRKQSLSLSLSDSVIVHCFDYLMYNNSLNIHSQVSKLLNSTIN